MLKRYLIERELPGVGRMDDCEMGSAARTSNEPLAQIPGLQWQHS